MACCKLHRLGQRADVGIPLHFVIRGLSLLQHRRSVEHVGARGDQLAGRRAFTQFGERGLGRSQVRFSRPYVLSLRALLDPRQLRLGRIEGRLRRRHFLRASAGLQLLHASLRTPQTGLGLGHRRSLPGRILPQNDLPCLDAIAFLDQHLGHAAGGCRAQIDAAHRHDIAFRHNLP